MVQYFERERSSIKGHKMFDATYLPDATAGPPIALVCFHHGVGEHCGRYRPFFERLASEGIAVYTGDAVGHGKSEGHRSLVPCYTDFIDDFLSLADFAKEDVQRRYPGSPLPPMFVAGQSLGGLFATLTAERDQGRWAGLLLFSPALDVELTPILRVQAALGNVLAALIPRARIVPAVDIKNLNEDPQRVQEYVDDPLNTIGNLPARTANESLKAMRWLRVRWPTFKLPIYVHHGDKDLITSPLGSQAFAREAASPDKTLKLVEGGYHELLFSPNCGEAIRQGVIDWIKQRAAGGGGAAKM